MVDETIPHGRPTWALDHTVAAHYVSTYCVHAAHQDCRLTCKTCDAPCRCPCHTDGTGPPIV